METTIIDGKAVARIVRRRVTRAVQILEAEGIHPRLDVLIVGDDPASRAYVSSKEKWASKLGIQSFTHELPEGVGTRDVLAKLGELNRDPMVHGVLVQLPLPRGVDQVAVIEAMDPARDVDGLTPYNQGRLFSGRPALVPCTPAGVMALLDHYGVDYEGKHAVVVGRSLLAGKPAAQLLLGRNATVTVCHSRTRDLPGVVSQADILVVAVGVPRMVKGSWIKPGAVVVDVGINRLEDGSLVGDVDLEGCMGRACAITPVPGGVGPMTIAMLMRNTVLAAASMNRIRGLDL